MQVTENRLRKNAESVIANEQEFISKSVDRLRHLPVAVAHHPSVIASLSAYQRGEDRRQAHLDKQSNEYLQIVSDAAGISLLYTIDAQGIARASNNWQTPGSLIGHDYQFRPYFQNAIVGSEARYYAVGVTTGEAGYYFAQPVKNAGEIVGIAVAKLEMESLQQQWQDKQPHSLLIDEEGIVILSSHAPWRYAATRTLSEQQRKNFSEQRKYANHALEALDTRGALTDRKLTIDGRPFISVTTDLPLKNWRLVQLTPMTAVYESGLIAAMVTGLLASLSFAIFLYRRERQRKNALSSAAKDAATMRKLNLELQGQIIEREKAEQDLEEAQSELIQASRLAALGQMSAAIAHEVNQPLSAIRTFSASTKLLLERGRMDEAHKNLEEIQALTERLAILTYDLKTFARKSNVPRELVSLAACVERVSGTLQYDLEERKISLQTTMPEAPVCIFGNAVRIEQVLSNLIRNAMDATIHSSDKGVVCLSVTQEGEQAVIRVQDNGHGMSEEDLAHVFDPFFTTKPLGEGVGLGLSIVYGIVEEMNGQIRVRNSQEGGALFSVRLPCRQEVCDS